MKTTHILLTIIIAILAFGVGVFVTIFFTPGDMNITQMSEGTNSTGEAPTGTGEETTTAADGVSSEGTTIDTSNLSEGQRTLLKSLGIDADTITITPEMVACAEGKVGAARLAEIQGGATPSFTEGLQLVSCYR